MDNPRPVKITKEVFERTFKPFVTLVFITLSKSDRFFDKITVNVNGEVFENSLEKLLKVFTSKIYSGAEEIKLNMEYSGLQMIDNGAGFVYSLDLIFSFNDEGYVIQINSASEETMEFEYGIYMQGDRIENIASRLLKDLMVCVEKEVKNAG